jgi:hypothetical protein
MMSSVSRAAGDAKSSDGFKRFDISNPNDFESFNKELITYVGMHCDGQVISAMREERLDYSLYECVFDADYTVVANGRKYKGVDEPGGLTYQLFREKYPLPVAMPAKEKGEAKKKHDLYCASVAKAIVIIEDKFEGNTLAHFENVPEYTKARDSQDLIALIRQVRLIGPVGTVSTGAALVNWQSFVSRPEGTRYSLVEGCKGDFNEFATRWRGLYATIRSLDKAQTYSEADHIRGVMRGLPDDDMILSSVKANNLATPGFDSMNQALRHLHDTITQANRDVSRCCESVGLAGVKRKQPDEGSGSQVDNQDANPNQNDASVEILKILKTLQSQAPSKLECRRYLKTGVCSWEKDHDKPCRFLHLGKNSKTEGVITKTQKESKKVKVVNPE